MSEEITIPIGEAEENPELDREAYPQDSSDVPSPEEPAPAPPQAAPLPLHIALPQQTRRVREQVLPAWYLERYKGEGNADPAIADHLMMINAALTTAEQAMMTQDVGQMLFAFRSLERF